MVDGTLELPYVPAAIHRLRNQTAPYPNSLVEISGADIWRIGERYSEECEVYRGAAPRFIDKMPNNFMHVGLIAIAIPNATIIDARRGAMDCCFSCFKQLFAEGQEFTYSLENVGRYYRAYVDLMGHWDSVLPGRILRVQHEEVVEDLERQVRRILEHCGLEFEPACLEYHNNPRPVRTASSEQVRQPVNSKGIGQWCHYAPWLDPLRKFLGSLAELRVGSITAREAPTEAVRGTSS
jgi:hypothetical protein